MIKMTTLDNLPVLDQSKVTLDEMSLIYDASKNRLPSDKLLTTITIIDHYIGLAQGEMRFLNNLKTGLLSRAIKEGVESDSGAVMIRVAGKQMRNPIINPKKFAEMYPEAYGMIRTQQKIKEHEKYTKTIEGIDDGEIPLGLADNCIGKENVSAFTGYQPQQITYEVRKISQNTSNQNLLE